VSLAVCHNHGHDGPPNFNKKYVVPLNSEVLVDLKNIESPESAIYLKREELTTVHVDLDSIARSGNIINIFSGYSTNKTDCHDITEILFKVALNTINLTIKIIRKRGDNPPTIYVSIIDWQVTYFCWRLKMFPY
jgi:hypothetical protein